MNGYFTILFNHENFARLWFAEWDKYANTNQAGWNQDMFYGYEANDIEVLYALGIIRFEPLDTSWYLTDFAIDKCIFSRDGTGPLVVTVPLE